MSRFALLLILCSSSAFATRYEPPEPETGDVTVTSNPTTSSSSTLDAVLEFDPQVEGGAAHLTQDQINEAVAEQQQRQDQANTQKVEINDVRPDDVKIRNVPNVYSPSIQATTSCFKPITGGVGWAGFGANGGSGVIDEACTKRELIRLAYAMGATARALFMWCQQPDVADDFGSSQDCLEFDLEEGEEDPDLSNLEPPPPTAPTGPLLAEVSEEEFEALKREVAELRALAAQKQREIQALEREVEPLEAQHAEQQQTTDEQVLELQKLRAVLREDYERVKSSDRK